MASVAEIQARLAHVRTIKQWLEQELQKEVKRENELLLELEIASTQADDSVTCQTCGTANPPMSLVCSNCQALLPPPQLADS